MAHVDKATSLADLRVVKRVFCSTYTRGRQSFDRSAVSKAQQVSEILFRLDGKAILLERQGREDIRSTLLAGILDDPLEPGILTIELDAATFIAGSPFGLYTRHHCRVLGLIKAKLSFTSQKFLLQAQRE